VRITLQGTEYSLRIAGAGAKNLFAALYAMAKGHHKSKGKTRLKSLLDAGKELKVLQLDAGDLATFAKEAKRYGLLYTIIKADEVKPEDKVDVMVKAEDAAKISRILDRLGYDENGAPHLRHTHATLLISNNVDIKTVQERLGHAKVATVIDLYAHADKQRDRAASDIFSSLIRPKCNEVGQASSCCHRPHQNHSTQILPTRAFLRVTRS